MFLSNAFPIVRFDCISHFSEPLCATHFYHPNLGLELGTYLHDKILVSACGTFPLNSCPIPNWQNSLYLYALKVSRLGWVVRGVCRTRDNCVVSKKSDPILRYRQNRINAWINVGLITLLRIEILSDWKVDRILDSRSPVNRETKRSSVWWFSTN